MPVMLSLIGSWGGEDGLPYLLEEPDVLLGFDVVARRCRCGMQIYLYGYFDQDLDLG